MVVADALIKRAPVRIALAEAVTPGKYLLVFGGGVAEVEESFEAAIERAGASVLDKLFLPMAASGLLEALADRYPTTEGESVGIVELHTVASTLLAADTVLKGADVWLTRLQLARGIGGKGYFILTGALHDVEVALELAAHSVEHPLLVATEIIQRPHPELRGPVL